MYSLYKTTNLNNGKEYIGIHKETGYKISETKKAFFKSKESIKLRKLMSVTTKEHNKLNAKDCPYCVKKQIGPSNYKRWHGDNCKHKGDIDV